MAVPSLFGDIALRLVADLQDAVGSWAVEVIAETPDDRFGSPIWFPSFNAAPPPAGQTYVTPWPFPATISILHGGREELRLAFWSVGGEPLSSQVAEALDHLQDVVAEETTEQWPLCPDHRHALIPVPDGDLVGWACPSSRQALVPLGGLARLRGKYPGQ
ncbi:hypothetical protein [Actinopolymorpha rutila]|uniref:Uncharacterized protein n=1 Tax=Actinopolymorpha rutila TaxID=446787 RepID=A0A852ZV09_9ACTN|nr:hypothetical protein [Actinopolymorpha rutila]NYH92810.1 hypothetical protein [Actinopolymorpha rutila]